VALKNPNAKHLRGGLKAGFDFERDKLEPSNNHRQEIINITDDLRNLTRLLRQKEQEGRWSKARKIRREINRLHEAELYITHSWCGGCKNYLHNCQCQAG
jgi:hypothetical protein